MHRSVLSISVAGLLAVGITACGSSTKSSVQTSASGSASTSAQATTNAAADHNAADATFAQKMIPHHQQALAMAALATAPKAAASAKVKDLAGRISAAQTPEIQLMQGWLQQWGATVSAGHDTNGSAPMGTTMGDMGTTMGTTMGDVGTTMGDRGGSDGMMTAADMQALATASGPAFDQLWLNGMIAHHQGAITMAKAEQQSGLSPQAMDLAGRIVTSQAAEVTEMQQLLNAG